MRYFRLTMVTLAVFSVPAPSLFAGTQSMQARDSVVKKIEAIALEHVNSEVDKQTQLVVKEFANNSAGLTDLDIATIYEKKYNSASTQIPSFLIWFVTTFGILTGIVAIAQAYARDAIKGLGTALYDRVAGMRPLQRFALNRYAEALKVKHENVFIPHRQNRPPLKMMDVFVPLRVFAGTGRRAAGHEGGTKNEQAEDTVDAFDAIRKNRAIMILGPPGSGKTLLLRRIALAYASPSDEYLPDEPVPVLLALRRLGSTNTTVKEQLAKVFERNGFPHAERFLAQALTRGTLMLLLDGLDEVDIRARPSVVQDIRDLLNTHKNCRVIITCRAAVYNRDFADVVDKTLEIVEFSDQQVQQFLSALKHEMPPEKSAEQLLRELRDRPRMMALARNPFLLTIVAFLYSDPNFTLPHSRVQFLLDATRLRLGQWYDAQNHYRMPDKHIVLQQLALRFFDTKPQLDCDRGGMGFREVLEELKEILPTVHLDGLEDAGPILDEIVNRSGLLLSVDGKERYQFAHQTLQEFLAAEALVDKEADLLERFRDDRESWREVVKLWCGLDVNSTRIIEGIHAIDPLTAFECLTDAKQVETALVDRLLEEFQKKLCGSEKEFASLASVASDPQGRGVKALAFLEKTLRDDADDARRSSAATALSLTNRSEAAEILASVCDEQPDYIIQLSNMGDLAVSPLGKRIRQAETEAALDFAHRAMDELENIATPRAALSLAPNLWDSNSVIAIKAAWHIARMLRNKKVEMALRTVPNWDSAARSTGLPWLWEPFGESPDSSLSCITGKTAELLASTKPQVDEVRKGPIDERIAVPLATGLVNADTELSTESSGTWWNLLRTDVRKTAREKTIRSVPKAFTRENWCAMFMQVRSAYAAGWHGWMADALATGLTVAAIFVSWIGAVNTWGTWRVGVFLPALSYLSASFLAMLVYVTEYADRQTLLRSTLANLAWPTAPWTRDPGTMGPDGMPEMILPRAGCVIVFGVLFVNVWVVAAVSNSSWMLAAAIVYVFILAVNRWLLTVALRRHRQTLNPFTGLFTLRRSRSTRRKRTAWFRRVRRVFGEATQ